MRALKLPRAIIGKIGGGNKFFPNGLRELNQAGASERAELYRSVRLCRRNIAHGTRAKNMWVINLWPRLIGRGQGDDKIGVLNFLLRPHDGGLINYAF